jgi:DNA ligase D-like protein (predicted 3'-phosphoesterase)
MTLNEYKSKRNLKKSKEPSAKKIISKSKKPIFVVHQHHASHLHYDLRLQMSGVLKSWAVPKTPPLAKGTKRLAIQVEDHPLAYSTFHGVIPEGNYGAGLVKIWDKGTYELLEKNPKSMKFTLHGKKLKGDYVLVKTAYGGKKNGWLFFRV